jgi:folylpolyglutamate synthase/dihydropteroate synthase
VIVKYIAERE